MREVPLYCTALPSASSLRLRFRTVVSSLDFCSLTVQGYLPHQASTSGFGPLSPASIFASLSPASIFAALLSASSLSPAGRGVSYERGTPVWGFLMSEVPLHGCFL